MKRCKVFLTSLPLQSGLQALELRSNRLPPFEHRYLGANDWLGEGVGERSSQQWETNRVEAIDPQMVERLGNDFYLWYRVYFDWAGA